MDDHVQLELNTRFVHTDNFFADQGAIWASAQFDPTKPILSGDTAYGGYYETLFAAGGNAGRPIPLAIRNPLGLIEQKEDVVTSIALLEMQELHIILIFWMD